MTGRALAAALILGLAACGAGGGAAIDAGDAGADAREPDACPNGCVPMCGDGFLSAGEACDDGNVLDGDGCTADCRKETCGDGVVNDAGAESCDDANSVDGDGCDSNCTVTGCGNGVVSAGEACDDGNLTDGDGCDGFCVIEVCGDGIVNDGGAETCDDGNFVAGDCCAACAAEAGCELEPNDSPLTANDYAALASAGGVDAWIFPAGDADVFRVQVPATGGPYLLIADSLDGPGASCALHQIDTSFDLYDKDGQSVAGGHNDDYGGTFCSHVVVPVAAGAYYLEVRESPLSGPSTFGYAVRITVRPIVCGDGLHDPGEQCDDGNLVAGDGCDATCRLEATPETEPNGGVATADGPFTADALVSAAIAPLADEDVFAVTNPTAAVAAVRFETFGPDGLGVVCALATDTVLTVTDGAGGTLGMSDDKTAMADYCSRVVTSIAPGATAYAHVIRYGNSATIATYFLQIDFP